MYNLFTKELIFLGFAEQDRRRGTRADPPQTQSVETDAPALRSLPLHPSRPDLVHHLHLRSALRRADRIQELQRSFWKGREQELHDIFSEIASVADILIGNEEDFQLCLNVKGPEAGGKDLASKIDGFKGMIEEVRRAYPNAQIFATTLRQVVSANEHLWGAILCAEGQWSVAEPRPIPVLDRIGGGDGFVSGLLYSLLRGFSYEDCLHFGWATGVLAVTSLYDYGTPADEDQVWDIWKGNARVKR